MGNQLNTRASTDARYSRTGKDAMLYDEFGQPFAQADSFHTKVGFNNSSYAPLGNNLELEAPGTVKLTITISEIVVTDGYLYNKVIDAINDGESPAIILDGVVQGRNGSQERLTYRECIFSGDQDLQNASTGDVLKRSYNLHCNSKPEKRSSLTI